MDIKPFKDLDVTTMTLVAEFSGKIQLHPIFCLLPITKIELPEKKRNTKKMKIPHCSIPGSILSLRFAGYTRGIYRTASRRHFRNSITIDISTRVKNISLKLSESKIQMCGPTSMEMGKEAISNLFKHIRWIQDELEYMQSRPNDTMSTVKWLVMNTQGNPTTRESKDVRQCKNVNLAIVETYKDYEVRIPSEKELVCAEKGGSIDRRVANFFLRLCPEFSYHSELCEDFDQILDLDYVLCGDLKCERISKAMVNYNYQLGFKIDRERLKTVFYESNDGWTARFDPRLDHTVTLQIPYEVPKEMQFMRKPDKVHCHTLMVQKSGVITQSGPDEELMKEAYYAFMELICENREYIETE